ncbi:hypothetical protein COOONC_19465 [Cooperia oncophora]
MELKRDAQAKAEGKQEIAKKPTAKGVTSPKEVVEATSRPIPPPPKQYPIPKRVDSDGNNKSKRLALANIDKPTPPASRRSKKKRSLNGPKQDSSSSQDTPQRKKSITPESAKVTEKTSSGSLADSAPSVQSLATSSISSVSSIGVSADTPRANKNKPWRNLISRSELDENEVN